MVGAEGRGEEEEEELQRRRHSLQPPCANEAAVNPSSASLINAGEEDAVRVFCVYTEGQHTDLKEGHGDHCLTPSTASVYIGKPDLTLTPNITPKHPCTPTRVHTTVYQVY